MIYLIEVLIEHKVFNIDKNFYYYFKEEVKLYSRVVCNFHNQKLIGFVVSCKIIPEESLDNFPYKIKEIEEIIDKESILNDELYQLARKLHDRYFYPLIGILNTILPKHLRSNRGSALRKEISIKYKKYYELIDLNYVSQNKLEEKILNYFNETKVIESKEINRGKTLDDLISRNIIKEFKVEDYRYVPKITFKYKENINLTFEQEKVFKDIVFSKDKVYLLKGVTGSGKTEIYLKLIEDAFTSRKTVLLLVPEIALTPLMISRILSYFKDETISVLHSSLTGAELYDEYRKIKENKVRLVIGTRSAIFVPLKDIKYIIIDEEHDSSYKQNEDLPYQTRDVAILRSEIEGMKVVLGSATPSIESMSKAKVNGYKLEELKNKYSKGAKNTKLFIDLKDKSNFKKSRYFSDILIEKIKETLDKNENIILLNNRRGSGSIKCKNCGLILKCNRCNLPYIYHKDGHKLICHHCGKTVDMISSCPICYSDNFEVVGKGIEIIEDEFKRLFPKVSYLRFDSDTMSSTFKIEEALDKFNKGEIKVIIGTDIISKGHDFKNVTLVSILNLDSLMNVPSFFSLEEGFSTSIQFIGRNAREKDGISVIQGSKKDSLLKQIIDEDYDSFYTSEIKRRMDYLYPPFKRLIVLKVCSYDINYLKDEIIKVTNLFKNMLPSDEVLASFIQERYKGYFSYKIYIKTKNLKETRGIITPIFEDIEKKLDRLRIYYDFY